MEIMGKTALVALAVMLFAPAALADGKLIVLDTTVVYGKPNRPLVVTEASKLPLKVTLAELRQPFVQRVEPTVQRAPF